jgi:integrase
VKRREEGAAPATINKELGTVRHVFNVAIREWEWCRDNPMHRVAMEKVHNARDRWLTEDEETRLLGAAPAWLQEIILFALHTGMRRGEILALNWADVDLTRGVLVVMKSKNQERRTIPLNVRVFELLVAKQPRSVSGGLPVFTTSCGTRLDGRNLMRGFYAALKEAGIENLTFHDLRHTFATRLVHEGVDLYKVQRLLGHKSPVMTQRYAHHCLDSLRDGVAVLVRSTGPRVTQFSHNLVTMTGSARNLPAQVVEKVGAGKGI